MLIEEHKAPADIANKAIELLVRPDKNSIEWKALNEASDKLSCMPLRLLLDVGAIPNAWRWHVESFFMINFPKGKNFPENLSKPHREAHDELPLSDAVAFSIDDSETTEIDDALSVTPLEDGKRALVFIFPHRAWALNLGRTSTWSLGKECRPSMHRDLRPRCCRKIG